MARDDLHTFNRVEIEADWSGRESTAGGFLNNLPGMIKKSFDRLPRDVLEHPFLLNKDIRLQKLECDFGEINESDFEYEFSRKLQKFLMQFLEQLNTHGPESVHDVQVVARPKSRMELLETMLRTGNIPWWAQSQSGVTLQSVLLEVLESSAKEFIALLKKLGRGATVRRRLSLRLSDEILGKIVRELEPAQADFIISYIDDTVQRNKDYSISGLSEKDFRPLLWDFVYEYLLIQNTTRFNRKSFVKWNIQRLANHYSTDYSQMLILIAGNSIRLRKRSDNHDSLHTILYELSRETDIQTVSPPQNDNARELNALERILTGKFNTSISKQKKSFQNLFRKTISQCSDQVLEIFRKTGKDESARHRMTTLMTVKQLQKLINIAEPEHSEFIVVQTERMVNIKEKYLGMNVRSDELESSTWYFILTYLFADRGTRFNQKSFLKSVLEQFAAHYDLNIVEIVQFYQKLFEKEKDGIGGLMSEISNEIIPHNRDVSEINSNKNGSYLSLISEIHAGVSNEQQTVKASQLLYYTATRDTELFRKTISENKIRPEQFMLAWHQLEAEKKLDIINRINPDRIRGWFEILKSLEKASSGSLLQSSSEILLDFIFEHAVLSRSGIEEIVRFYIEQSAQNRNMTVNELMRRIRAGESNPHVLSYLGVLPGDISMPKAKEDNTPLLVARRLIVLAEQKKYTNDESIRREIIGSLLTLPETLVRSVLIHLSIRGLLSEIISYISEENWKRMLVRLAGKKTANYIQKVVDVCSLLPTFYKAGSVEQELRVAPILYLIYSTNTSEIEYFFKYLSSGTQEQVSNMLSSKKMIEITQNLTTSQQKIANKLSNKLFKGKTKPVHLIDEPEIIHIAKGIISANRKVVYDYPPVLFTPVLLELLKKNQVEIRNEIIRNYRDPQIRSFWLQHFPDVIIRLIFSVLISKQYNSKLDAWLGHITTLPGYLDSHKLASLKNKTKLEYVAEFRFSDVDPSRLLKTLMFTYAVELPESKRRQALLNVEKEIIRQIEHTKPQEYDKVISKLKTVEKPTIVKQKQTEPEKQSYRSFDEDLPFDGDSVFTNRAGIIITAPFFNQLFSKLQYLDGKIFQDEEQAFRAMHIMEYIATGSTEVEEHHLFLYKILAGVPVTEPVPQLMNISDGEKAIADDMLSAVISNWDGIGSTSTDGLRESFLNREGRISDHGEHWELVVESRAFDVLLDRIPWGIGMIKLPWMKKLLKVQWR